MPDNGARSVCITHAAAVTPLGLDLEGSWSRLCRGRSGIAPVTRFDTSGYLSPFAAHVPGLAAGDGDVSLLFALLEPLLPELAAWPLNNAEAGSGIRFYIASTKAGIDMLERWMLDGAMGGVPPLAALLPGEMRSWLGARLGLDARAGENLSAACASGSLALIRAAQAIGRGLCSRALALTVDMATAFTMSGFSALQALSPEPCRPFDQRRDGLTMGEGAAALLLMSASEARARGLRPLAWLQGWGLSADARHITAPDREARGLIRAVRQAMTRAQLSAVDAICAHGTGTVYNDAMELTAFCALFDDLPPFFSAKGALGHAMAASGGIEAALCCRILETGCLPPTLGCTRPEERGRGKVSPECQNVRQGAILSTNSGFGGVNTALLFASAPGGVG